MKIVNRFFDCIYALQKLKKIRGKKTFCERYHINRWNFNTVEKQPESNMFKIAWLTYLVKDYGISAIYLLTGDGNVFSDPFEQALYNVAKDKKPYKYNYQSKSQE